MELLLKQFQVNNVSWGEATVFENNQLFIDKQELLNVIKDDACFKNVEIELVHPGEKTRIVNILDVLDARCKEDGEGVIYPGVLDKLGIAGVGTTHVLDGLLIAEVGQVKDIESFHLFYTGTLDMSGPAAEISSFSQKHVLVLNMQPNTDSPPLYDMAIKKASLKVSMYLAQTTLNKKPDLATKYELKRDEQLRAKRLPKIAYVYITENHEETKISHIYGTKTTYYLPFILHPNEFFDGCMVHMSYTYPPGLKNYTYNIINNPTIKELYARHGKDLDFVGVIVANANLDPRDKHKSSVVLGKLAKYNLGVDGVIITKEGGGHPEVDQMLCCEQCEKLGIKTSLIDTELLSSDGSGNPLVFFAEHADCLISLGNYEEIIELPAVDKLVGCNRDNLKYCDSLQGIVKMPYGAIANALSLVGNSRVKAVEY